MFDYTEMMKKMQNLQSNMNEMQEKLAKLEITGVSGAGLVKVTLSGNGELRDISIDQSLLKPDEKEVIEDLIVAAYNDAHTNVKTAVSQQMKEVSGGALPFGSGMPFLS